jgi:hypothetical protein
MYVVSLRIASRQCQKPSGAWQSKWAPKAVRQALSRTNISKFVARRRPLLVKVNVIQNVASQWSLL